MKKNEDEPSGRLREASGGPGGGATILYPRLPTTTTHLCELLRASRRFHTSCTAYAGQSKSFPFLCPFITIPSHSQSGPQGAHVSKKKIMGG